jgi:two-component system chemotaxis response regulator CheV
VANSVSAGSPGILLEAGTNEVELLVFRVGQQRCGVNVAKVREARPLETVTFLPEHPETVEGVVRVRDQVVPMVDLCKYLWGSTPEDDDGTQRHLLLEFNNRTIAFRVQAIDQVHRVSWRNILPVPAGIGTEVPLTGIVLLKGEIVLLLDFESVGASLGISGSTHIPDELVNASATQKLEYPLVFADDSALIRRMMTDALEAAGYTDVRVFVDGEDAWRYLRELADRSSPTSIRQAIGGVITDIEMPQMDGFTLTKKIREHPVLKDVPVILFSSLISKDNEKKGIQVGATAQVSKPKWEELSLTLMEILGKIVSP